MKCIAIFFAMVTLCYGEEVSPHILQAPLPYDLETEGPPQPYSFQYAAGRYPGHVDRTHSETGDGSGHVQGSYSFVDPKMKVRTVEYHVDEKGYHPSLINYEDVMKQPLDTEAVRNAKERHRILYENAAAGNYQGYRRQSQYTPVVQQARDRHFYLFNKIAAEHAAIGAEREADRVATTNYYAK